MVLNFRRFVGALYLYRNDSERQNEFDQSKISNYYPRYVEDFVFFFVLSLSYYSVWFIVSLLPCNVFRRLIITLYLYWTISTDKTDSISRIYYNMVIVMLKN